MVITATYSPDDNKLRLYASSKLDADLYARVKAAGFAWAPKQDLFVAPKWTPEREDLAAELAGTIDDEDKSLVERAEERAERFEDYSESRKADADAASERVSTLANGIPLGQPILVGHHSEKRARKDAEKIRTGMERAVRMWDQSKYWTQRAAGALHHAKYKERPGVRARRIKGLEADQRKAEKSLKGYRSLLRFWTDPTFWKDGQPLTLERARKYCGMSEAGYLPCVPDTRFGYASSWNAADVLKPDGERYADCPAWTLEQCVERAAQHYPECMARAERWLSHYANRLAYERAMLAESGGTAADQTKPEKGGACRCWVYSRGWATIQKVNKVSVTVLDNWGNGGKDFTRTVPFDKLSGVMSKAQVDAAREAGRVLGETPRGFQLADGEPPKPRPVAEPDQTAETMAAMKASLRAGVQTMSAPQLFPTPPELAARVVELAGIRDGDSVLEPSAGTGNLLRAIFDGAAVPGSVMAVEISLPLADNLRAGFASGVAIQCADFINGTDWGLFDRVVMNPPFENASDIDHVQRAVRHLKPGGRLVAICANGPRQREQLRPLASEWIDLEPGAFKASGTNVNAAICVIDA